METVTKKAWNPDTNQEYEIELPAPHLVEAVLLEIDFPLNGLPKKKIAEILEEHFSLTDEQRKAKNKNQVRVFHLYVGFISRALINAGKLVELTSGWRDISRRQASEQVQVPKQYPDDGFTPEKSIEENYHKIREGLAVELLQQIKSNTPTFFEELVIDLLVAMGYGGSREDAGKAVGRGGDGGIDGIINEDRLGLDVVYVQAKRWEGNVSRPEIQKFAGALQGQRARKGIFITTSDFTRDAEGYVKTIDSKIILINGKQLAEYMIEHNVGVSTTKTYEIKRVDSDYFAEGSE
ncbi:MAG: restriction endonuclease [Candidatus Poribacteria bacterium]|nr:restriction endonuclease [Candidatus Poribacteria bacterium]